MRRAKEVLVGVSFCALVVCLLTLIDFWIEGKPVAKPIEAEAEVPFKDIFTEPDNYLYVTPADKTETQQAPQRSLQPVPYALDSEPLDESLLKLEDGSNSKVMRLPDGLPCPGEWEYLQGAIWVDTEGVFWLCLMDANGTQTKLEQKPGVYTWTTPAHNGKHCVVEIRVEEAKP